MRQKLVWEDIGLGDILYDFIPPYQKTIHYLVVDSGRKMMNLPGPTRGMNETDYFVLHPLDSGDDYEIELTPYSLKREYATWRKKA